MVGASVAALCISILLVVAEPVFARSGTTNAPAILTVKVTLTDSKISMTPNHAARGSTVTFILTNRGKKKHTFAFGAAKPRLGLQGFARTLASNQQATVVLFLGFRGVLKYTLRVPKSTASIARGSFRIT